MISLKNLFLFVSLAIVGLSQINVYASGLGINPVEEILNKRADKNLFESKEEVSFYIFASLGLSDNILKQMFEYAKAYNGVIVLRGIEDNSFIKTSNHIQMVAKTEEEAAIIIDPTLFKKFQITQVPTYVLAKTKVCPAGVSCASSFDKITGNITPKFALEKFAEKGDLSQEAQSLLGGNKWKKGHVLSLLFLIYYWSSF